MPSSERGLPFSTEGLVGQYGQWTVPSYKNEPEASGGAGKRAAVRAGGSASRASGDQSSTDSGGGFRRNQQRKSHTPGGNSKWGHWAADSQEFPSWRRRGWPVIPRDQPVPVPPKWTSDRRALRRRSPGIWTGGCAAG